ncbi:hypothetical protein DUNSADRAFT_9959 [Dunaliella salina]|uniref:Uncharacterized protein n=1 Tax=Dunaliella salina TaxID=3046 RepID=A0ABQ7GGF4_DUNSA|nr:hypothetical protein DUNSADRAFT_9959 [Dunaliella salina]|eukprot:KAF5833688.1 hypothetical protein DUNSADRAFT_9959 [Dunaliella salina]
MVDNLQAMPRELELRPPIPTDESLRPIAEDHRKGNMAAREAAARLMERRRFHPKAVREGDWLPYIKAAMLQRQHAFLDGQEKLGLDREQPALQQGKPGTMGILPLHVREHLAVLERCTRNFSDALALVLSAQLPAQQTDKAMQDKETGLSQRTEEDEQRHRADWADRHRLLSIFESMKEIAADQAAERRALEEHACCIIQRAWRSMAASRRSRPGGVHLPCTPDKRPPRGPRSARLRGWLRGASSTNTGFGRSMDNRAANTSLLERHSGGFYQSLMATAGQASRAKRAAAVHTPDQTLPPGSSQDEQAEAAGDKAAAEVLAAGGSRDAAQEARRAAMQRAINAYHAGAAAAAAAAAERKINAYHAGAAAAAAAAAEEARTEAMQRVINADHAGAAAAAASAAEGLLRQPLLLVRRSVAGWRDLCLKDECCCKGAEYKQGCCTGGMLGFLSLTSAAAAAAAAAAHAWVSAAAEVQGTSEDAAQEAARGFCHSPLQQHLLLQQHMHGAAAAAAVAVGMMHAGRAQWQQLLLQR